MTMHVFDADHHTKDMNKFGGKKKKSTKKRPPVQKPASSKAPLQAAAAGKAQTDIAIGRAKTAFSKPQPGY